MAGVSGQTKLGWKVEKVYRRRDRGFRESVLKAHLVQIQLLLLTLGAMIPTLRLRRYASSWVQVIFLQCTGITPFLSSILHNYAPSLELKVLLRFEGLMRL